MKLIFSRSTSQPDLRSKYPLLRIANVFLPFASGYFLSYLFRTINGPISSQLIKEFGLNTENLGLLTSVYFLTFAACQMPYGPLVDRFGPRRVQGIVLMIGAIGAALFGVAQNMPTLVLARALIGIGTSGSLMAGLKALALWVPKERRTLVNGGFIMFGGLGAMASTLPVTLVLPAIGWRGIFLLLAGASVVSAITVLLVVPDAPAQAPVEDWRSNLRGVREVYRDPAFWSLAPLSACIVGTAFAVHGLWAARWLAEVDHYDTHRVASAVFAMGTGLTLGAGLIGVVGERARRHGMQPTTTFGLACALFIVLQLMALERVQLPAWLLWGAIASFGSITVLSYSIIGEMFPPERIGRANGALNVLHLGMAFVLQYGMGVVASFWHADFFGHLPAIAYRAAFSLPLLLEFLALTWFVFALTASQRRIGEQADDEVSMATPEVSP